MTRLGVKYQYYRDMLLVGGGACVSALSVETMKESKLDLALIGEADPSFGEVR